MKIKYSLIPLLLLVSCMALLFRSKPRSGFSDPETQLTFSGSSDSLESTIITPTLDCPMEKGKNIIWCASFAGVWKQLQNDILHDPVNLEGCEDICRSMNNMPDPREFISEKNLYLKAGIHSKELIKTIHNELSAKFPGKSLPIFGGLKPDYYLLYSYLETSISFQIPYFQSREPLVFTDNDSNKTKINSFGIRAEDSGAFFELRKQPSVLYEKIEKHELIEFAIDLDSKSQPDQIIISTIIPAETLEKTVSYLMEKISDEPQQGIGAQDWLLVPDIFWKISHNFTEIEGATFNNDMFHGIPIDIAKQEITFKLNRSGAELSSEAWNAFAGIPGRYVFSGPFLICMKKRDSSFPYFVMWVENAELLNKWKPGMHKKRKKKEVIDLKAAPEEETKGFVKIPGDVIEKMNLFGYTKKCTVSSFYIMKSEVTQGDYSKLMASTYISYRNPSWNKRLGIGDNYPVYKISWYDAVLYCNAMSKRDNYDTVYSYKQIKGKPGKKCEILGLVVDTSKYGYRLPTREEWICAAEGGKNLWHPTDDGTLFKKANYGNRIGKITEVGCFPKNPYGLYDMAGNVWEYCNEIDTTFGETRFVLTGGCWNTSSFYMGRYAKGFSVGPHRKWQFNGIRVVLPIK